MVQILPQEITEHVLSEIKIFEQSNLWHMPWWVATSSGRLTVKSAWDIERHKEHKNKNIAKNWIKDLPFKMLYFCGECEG